jgi:hypothetical protein
MVHGAVPIHGDLRSRGKAVTVVSVLVIVLLLHRW